MKSSARAAVPKPGRAVHAPHPTINIHIDEPQPTQPTQRKRQRRSFGGSASRALQQESTTAQPPRTGAVCDPSATSESQSQSQTFPEHAFYAGMKRSRSPVVLESQTQGSRADDGKVGKVIQVGNDGSTMSGGHSSSSLRAGSKSSASKSSASTSIPSKIIPSTSATVSTMTTRQHLPIANRLSCPPLAIMKTFQHLSHAAKYAESVVLHFCGLSCKDRDAIVATHAPRVFRASEPCLAVSTSASAPHSIPDLNLVRTHSQANTKTHATNSLTHHRRHHTASSLASSLSSKDARTFQHDITDVRLLPHSDTIHIVADVDDTVVISDDAFGDEMAVPLAPIVLLLRHLARHPVFGPRVHIHFVTARLHDPEDPSTNDWTLQQLAIIRAPPHTSLHLAPAQARKSRVAISKWKFSVRESIARAAGVPIVLTIGDQASDLFPIDADKDFEAFDALMDAERMPFGVVQPGDGVTLWGLKLRARY